MGEMGETAVECPIFDKKVTVQVVIFEDCVIRVQVRVAFVSNRLNFGRVARTPYRDLTEMFQYVVPFPLSNLVSFKVDVSCF